MLPNSSESSLAAFILWRMTWHHSTKVSMQCSDSSFSIADLTPIFILYLDWQGMYRGSTSAVLRPRNTEEASAILAYCNSRRLAVNLQVRFLSPISFQRTFYECEHFFALHLFLNILNRAEILGSLAEVFLSLTRSLSQPT